MKQRSWVYPAVAVPCLVATLVLFARAVRVGGMIPVVNPPTVNVVVPTPATTPLPAAIAQAAALILTRAVPTPTELAAPTATPLPACPARTGDCRWPTAPVPPSVVPPPTPYPTCLTPVPGDVCTTLAVPTGAPLEPWQ